MRYKNLGFRQLNPGSSISGMTLVEMLTVIAIISILSLIIVPAINSARISLLQRQGSIQFQRFIHALRDYYSEYRSYPPFISVSEDAASIFTLDTVENSRKFIGALTGKEPGGAELTAEHLSLNPKRIAFLELAPEDFLKTSSGDRDEEQIADIFNNQSISFLVESPTDENRRIPKNLFPEAMQSYVPDNGLLSDMAVWSISSGDSRRNIRSWQ
jgi:prepilin-type N-terminal cleavage/methylation domain-containing protein